MGKAKVEQRINKVLRDFRKKAMDLPLQLQQEINGPINTSLWEAFANRNCRYCNGSGINKLLAPKAPNIKLVPCQCSINKRKKIYESDEKKALRNVAWKVYRKVDGKEVVEIVLVKQNKE